MLKKNALVLSVLGMTAGLAQAQSSVTMFGVLDVNARTVKNGSVEIRQLGNNGIGANQFGVRGIEDLGGGLRAGFWLESAISPDVGTATTENGNNKFWQRRSTVSLISNLGEIRLGRDLDPSYRNIATDAFGNLGTGSLLNFVTGLGSGVTTIVRADNLVQYLTPNTLGGFFGAVGVAAGEGVPGNRYVAARAGFERGPVFVAASVGNTKTATVDDYQLSNIAATYDLKVVKVLGLYNIQKWGDLEQKLLGLGAQVPVGALSLRASYVTVDQSGRTTAGVNTADNDAKLIAVGAVYSLSRRTALYTTAARISNEGRASFSVSGGAGVVPAAAAVGAKSTGFEVGVRHSF